MATTGTSTALKNTNLFNPIKLGSIELKHRLVHAPTTRLRASEEFVLTDSVLKYYSDRSKQNGGLLIFEATAPSLRLGLYNGSPVLNTDKQVASFKKVADAIHENGSFFAVQLWGLGRTSDPALLKKHNLPFVAPSKIYPDEAKEKYAISVGNELRELTEEEIKEIIADHVYSAKRAVHEANIDIIELHGAHMYLIDQFLNECSNQRTDKYGGSIENRARFLFELLDALIEAVGADHVAIRLSPYAAVQGGQGVDSRINPIVTWGYVLSELERRAQEGNRIAYVSTVEPRVSGVTDVENDVDFTWPDLIWKGNLIRAGAYLHGDDYVEKVTSSVERNDRTLIAVGRCFSSNPDLVERIKNGLKLTPYEREHFYNIRSNVGYNCYGKYGEEKDHSLDDVTPKEI